ncbi:hypothetical protein Tco_1328400 [Tanacetum coccineum]
MAWPEEVSGAPPSPGLVPGPELVVGEIVALDPEARSRRRMTYEALRRIILSILLTEEMIGRVEMDIEEDEDSTAPSAEETEPFETDESAATPPPHPATRMTARDYFHFPEPFTFLPACITITTCIGQPPPTSPSCGSLASSCYDSDEAGLLAYFRFTTITIHPLYSSPLDPDCTTTMPTNQLLTSFPPLSITH